MSYKLCVVFDLDKTIGYFTQIAIFLKGIEEYMGRKLSKGEMFHVFDLYPSIFRPGIMNTFKYLKKEKKKNKNLKVMIYTNNIGPKSWVYDIKNYIENRLKKKIFDRVIAAWKVGTKTYEKCRASHYKTVDDLRKCGKLGSNSKILFLDDQRHPNMIHEDVTYLFLYEYHNDILFEKIIETFLNSKIGKKILKKRSRDFEKFFMNFAQNDPLGYRYIEKKNNISNFNENFITSAIIKFIENNKMENVKRKVKKRLKLVKKSYNEDNNYFNRTRIRNRDSRRLMRTKTRKLAKRKNKSKRKRKKTSKRRAKYTKRNKTLALIGKVGISS